jgi:hypothetical protein
MSQGCGTVWQGATQQRLESALAGLTPQRRVHPLTPARSRRGKQCCSPSRPAGIFPPPYQGGGQGAVDPAEPPRALPLRKERGHVMLSQPEHHSSPLLLRPISGLRLAFRPCSPCNVASRYVSGPRASKAASRRGSRPPRHETYCGFRVESVPVHSVSGTRTRTRTRTRSGRPRACSWTTNDSTSTR